MAFFYALVSYGICFGLQTDKFLWLTSRLRHFDLCDRSLDCTYCTGFFTGILVFSLKEHLLWDLTFLIEMLCFGFFSAIFCYILDLLTQMLENHISKVKSIE